MKRAIPCEKNSSNRKRIRAMGEEIIVKKKVIAIRGEE
jgi:hypothetical protein